MNNKLNNEVSVQGIPVSEGIAIGTVVILECPWDEIIEISIKKNNIENELNRYQDALKNVVRQLVEYEKRVKKEIGKKEAQIFEAQLTILNDSFFQKEIPDAIVEYKKNAEFLLKKGIEKLRSSFEKMNNDFFQQRIADIEDVAVRIVKILLQSEELKIPHKSNTVIVSHNLKPSDTIRIDKTKIVAFITELGGETSHASILARSMGIPAIVGIERLTERVENGDKVIVDGNSGSLYINPPKQLLKVFQQRKKNFEHYLQQLDKDRDLDPVTRDGAWISLKANIAMVSDINLALKYRADGVGLFRTELPFIIAGRLLTEDEQFEIYKAAVTRMKDKIITIRTLDLGGDKFLPFQYVEEERNPFLGWRSIRIFLQEEDVFKDQLRAILRASAFGNVRILFPMISSYEEVIKINEIVQKTKTELDSKNIPFDKNIKSGIMVEIPSIAIVIDQIIKYIDYVSIGTNDLIQYTLAVDRNNEKVAKFYNPNNPAVLRLVKNIIKVANNYGKPVSVCGELAANPLYTGLLLGFGLRNFSMIPLLIPELKERIRVLKIPECEELAKDILDNVSASKIIQILWDFHIQANKKQSVPSVIKQIS
ncbi:MAG: phosphoenolpyruvate--protein phosphotransferase [bacterium]